MNVIYLDANGTTLPAKTVMETHDKWMPSYNPSSSSAIVANTRKMIERAIAYIHAHNNTSPETHEILFTSGGSESNSTIFRQTADAVHQMVHTIPHIISTDIEHASTLLCLEDLKNRKKATYALVRPNVDGIITAAAVEKAIKSTGKPHLVSVMYANNETGAINEIREIGELCLRYKIPFHVDAVQMYGKYRINIAKYNITALSASFHKLYGPKGVGLLIVNKQFIDGYGITGMISGHQQHGLRGGTENVPGIASSLEALRCAFVRRDDKNTKLHQRKMYIIDAIAARYKTVPYSEYKSPPKEPQSASDDTTIVLFGQKGHSPKHVACNTLLLSIVTVNRFCNIEFKKLLDQSGIIVSIASNCLTSQTKASHVMYALNVPSEVRRGVLRISIGDNNTDTEIKQFCKIFFEQLDAYIRNIGKVTEKPLGKLPAAP